ncbi:MAG: urease accessory protein UreE [Bacteroidota bacterium]
MIVTKKIGNIHSLQSTGKYVDWLHLEWYETAKRIMHQRTESGRELVIKFLGESQQLAQGDILFEDDASIIAVDILATNTIIIEPVSMYEMAAVCYEIGNKHLPLFYEQNHLLIPFELPLYRLLVAQGYQVKQAERKLLQPLKTTVSPHGSANNSETIFSKIMRMTTASNKSKGEV